MRSAAARTFWTYGKFCASHPCEVLFIIITLTLTMMSFVDWQKDPRPSFVNPDYHGIDVIFMIVIMCIAILYTYHQFQSLSRIGSKYLYGIAAAIVVFSSLVFCCTVLILLDCDISDLKEAVFYFLLLTDLNKARFLVQFALDSSSYIEVQKNIAEGISLLGPSLTLDTIAEALLIGAGTLSGVSRVEQICRYAVLAVIVNYIFLVSFYPSFLSLVLELSHRCSSSTPPWPIMSIKSKIDTPKSNPILQGVKIIMSAGLFLVHGITRWSFDPERQRISVVDLVSGESRNASTEPPFIVQWLNAGLCPAVVLVIFGALGIKYKFFETPLPQRLGSEDKNFSKKSMKKPKMVDYASQTEASVPLTIPTNDDLTAASPQRTVEECLEISQMQDGFSRLTDDEVYQLLEHNHIPQRTLETKLKNTLRAIKIRRSYYSKRIHNKDALDNLPFRDYNYDKILGSCCENVIGYICVPVGIAGPLKVNGIEYMIPLATTEGALVASTSRGCKAISSSGGAVSIVFKDEMSRGPVIELPTVKKVVEVYDWIKEKENFPILEDAFNATSNFARLTGIFATIRATWLYIRFSATTGDAMGMNMVAKGTEAALLKLKELFPEINVISISGNVCTDKKHSAINWILGRGKSVVCDVTIPAYVVKTVLKSNTKKLVKLNEAKNHQGSSVAGSIGGNNCHAANIIAALFIACGQDPAQVVDSSYCSTMLAERGESGEDLYAAVTMPCIELGTVGGGTSLPSQAACLNILGIKGPSKESPGENASRFASIAAAAVLAGELSLMASLAEGTLVKSHMTLNRSTTGSAPCSGAASGS